ncbi:MAG: hypothetical protein ACE5F6_00165 [Anaerolineae bacterium]
MDNIRWLCKYGSAFNNRLLINIKTGRDMANPNFVKTRFAPLEEHGDVEFRLIPNDPKLHELAGFLEGLSSLKSTRDDEITFYAHTKGVRKAVVECSQLEQTSVRQWRNRMYDECLSNPERIEAVFIPKQATSFFVKKPVAAAGCFLCKGQYGKHFAGTYYWVRHSLLFTRDWEKIPTSRFGPEEYIAIQFQSKELHCLRKVKDPLHVTFYSEISATYRCQKCGPFEAAADDKVRCPRCKRQTSFVEKINDMGF